jgi:hypothetical protein
LVLPMWHIGDMPLSRSLLALPNGAGTWRIRFLSRRLWCRAMGNESGRSSSLNKLVSRIRADPLRSVVLHRFFSP